MLEITLTFTGDQQKAIEWTANRFGITTQQVVRKWMDNELDDAVRLFRERRWIVRQRAIETDPVLAATVDAAAEAP